MDRRTLHVSSGFLSLSVIWFHLIILQHHLTFVVFSQLVFLFSVSNIKKVNKTSLMFFTFSSHLHLLFSFMSLLLHVDFLISSFSDFLCHLVLFVDVFASIIMFKLISSSFVVSRLCLSKSSSFMCHKLCTHCVRSACACACACPPSSCAASC